MTSLPAHWISTAFLQAADAAGVDPDTATDVAEKATEAAVEADGGTGTLQGFLTFVIVIGFLVVPFVLAWMISKALKVPDWSNRFGVVFLTLSIAIAPFVTQLVTGKPLGELFRLGIDLAGGTNLVYQLEEVQGKSINAEVIDRMVGAVDKRINPGGEKELTIRGVGEDRLEVIVPGANPQEVDEIKDRITNLGSLEFFIMASPDFDSTVIALATQLDTETKEVIDPNNKTIVAYWRPVIENADRIPQTDRFAGPGVVRRPIRNTRPATGGGEETYETEEYLVIVGAEERRVTGEFLTRAAPGTNENGELVVNFNFNAAGAFRFQSLTAKHQPEPGRPKRQLAILLNGYVNSAPNLNDVISDSGQISGVGDRAEIDELVSVLNAGALEVPIQREPLSEATISPLLGQDVRKKGLTAIGAAGLLVIVFMLVYYRFAGLVAVICLLANLVLVVGAIVFIQATITLPGLAGLVLTIGMAVDANVLIFERMREEVRRGASLRMAIQNGFDKAFSTIVDANVTTLITAAILYSIGTSQVKGFAVTLFIGILTSMFTALYVGRLIFDLAAKKGWITKLGMFSLVGETNWNFVGKRRIAAVVSVALIGIGLTAFFSRGAKNYDIDFTGGTMVSFQFEEEQTLPAVRDILVKNFGDAITVEKLSLEGEAMDEPGKYFRLRTTISDTNNDDDESVAAVESESTDTNAPASDDGPSAENRVKQMVADSFAEQPTMTLRRVEMSFTDVASFEEPDAESAAALTLARFSGGQQSTIDLSSEVAEATIQDTLAGHLGEIQEDGNPKYGSAKAMFAVEGLRGSGVTADQGDVRLYDQVVVRTLPEVAAVDLQTALQNMETKMDSEPLFDEVNTFASAVASEMKTSAIQAIIVSLLAIVAYIWFRFQRITFGLAAVVALVHDVLIVLGVVALASLASGNSIADFFLLNDFRINLPMIAAFLTIVGYSLNDTIVVFDRIREVRGKNPALTEEMVNTSLNQTLSRTLLTSVTTFLVVIILYTIGGEGIHGFAFCLTIGVIVGTYSSIYVASPVLIWLMNRSDKKQGATA